jgi:hypothetical protein
LGLAAGWCVVRPFAEDLALVRASLVRAVGQRTASTRVCWHMISETHTP